jgi:hypothetical protein
MKSTLKQRQREADDARTANYNHRLTERLRQLRENPQDSDDIRAEMERDFIATHEHQGHKFSADDSLARTIIFVAMIAIAVGVIAELIK